MHYAHSIDGAPEASWEPLVVHLLEVGDEAALRASKFGWGESGRAAGRLHDLGKYKQAFQDYIRKKPVRPEDKIHSTAGALFAQKRLGLLGKYLSHAIAGHHSGLKNGLFASDGRLAREAADLDIALIGHATAPDRLDLTFPALSPPLTFNCENPGVISGFQSAFLTRMLFSCLVDADYVCTERFYAKTRGRSVERGPGCEIVDLADAFSSRMRERARQRAETPSAQNPLNRRRDHVLAHSLAHAQDPRGVFTLTVPTGGGKTLTSLAFALEHARYHRLDRVVVVIPFTSVIEQTAAVYRNALAGYEDEILEHHSAFDESALGKNEARQGLSTLSLAMETWDARLIVTTAVQFFESLFSDRPSRCRKLHNIVNSVIIIDEVQTLPIYLLRPCVAALKELTLNYGSSIVLCTATQPALEDRVADSLSHRAVRTSFAGGFRSPTELAPDVPGLFRALRRVTVEYIGQRDDDVLAAKFAEVESALCVVNTRAHANAVFDRIKGLAGARHLSTLMHAVHRSTILAAIRADLDNGRPCRVVSTSLIEAGVDISFGLVMRAEAGLDQIAQAAGRCNREGDPSGPMGRVLVFSPAGRTVHRSMALNVQVGLEMLRRHADDPLAPDAITDYFETLYWRRGESELDRHGVLATLKGADRTLDFPFETVARNMQLIDDIMRPVVVPTDEESRYWITELEHQYRDAPIYLIARKLQRYTVGITKHDQSRLLGDRVAHYVRPKILGDQFMVLDNLNLYKPDIGLDCSDPSLSSASQWIM